VADNDKNIGYMYTQVNMMLLITNCLFLLIAHSKLIYCHAIPSTVCIPSFVIVFAENRLSKIAFIDSKYKSVLSFKSLFDFSFHNSYLLKVEKDSTCYLTYNLLYVHTFFYNLITCHMV